MLHTVIIILIVTGILAANLPWLSERLFLFFEPPGGHKTIAMRLLEWLLLLMLFVLGALGTENKILGSNYPQGWEFYTVLVCLFVVFALPGFIYRHDLKPHLDKRERRSK